jgi:hypothetical protein
MSISDWFLASLWSDVKFEIFEGLIMAKIISSTVAYKYYACWIS